MRNLRALGQLAQQVKVGQAAPDCLGLGLGAVAQHKTSREVGQETGHQVGTAIVELDSQVVLEELMDRELAKVSKNKFSSGLFFVF